MTGAPIYLVSACASGEEFVAAFRRYADKNGLFVPISEPLPSGCRSRFAVTLTDGGVMIEGEAEIISSARTASVLHGRVGMTLRFVEPDDTSKIMLGELEKARLAMRPAPPSVAPRPAEIPAQPRPVPPPVQGRIDAVNALAECVAIGDTGALGPPAAAATIVAPPKAGPRFVMPVVPPAIGPGVAPRPATAPQAATAPRPVTAPQPLATPPPLAALPPLAAPQPLATPKPIVIAKPDERKDVMPPPVTPRATPQPEPRSAGPERRSDPAQAVPTISGFSSTMTAVAPVLEHGPLSDTFVAVTPPEPPARAPGTASSTAPRRAVEMPAALPRPITKPQPAQTARDPLLSDTITAVPTEGLALPSSPTDVGRARLDPTAPVEHVGATPSRDDLSSPTQVHAGAPTREAQASPPRPPSATPPRATPTSLPPRPPARDELAQTLRGPKVDLAEPAPQTPTQTQRSQPSEMLEESEDSEVPELQARAETNAKGAVSHVATHIGMPPVPRGPAPANPPPAVLTPAPPIVAPPRPSVPEIEIAEPTDLSLGPPEPVVTATMPPAEVAPQPPEPPSSRPRKTVIGVAIVPPGVTVVPAATTPDAAPDTASITVTAAPGEPEDVADASLLAADEVTGAARIVVGDRRVDASAPTLPPTPRFPARVPAMVDDATPSPAPIAPPASAMPASLPSKPPPTPPGLVAPAAPVAPAGLVPALPSGDWTIALDPQAPDGWSEPLEVLSAEHLTEDPAPNPAPAAVADAQPRELEPRRLTPHPDELPIAEPKVQIDPTLIEPPQPMPAGSPLRPMPPDAMFRPMPDDPFRDAAASSPSLPGYGAAPPMGTMPPMTPMPPSPFLAPHGPPGRPAGEAPAYPMNPSYQMIPMAGLAAPGSLPAGDSGHGDPRYASATTWPVQNSKRRAIIVIVSALVAVVIGIVVLAVVHRKHDAGTERDKPRPEPAAPKPPKTAAITPDPAHPAPKTAVTTPDPAHPAPGTTPVAPTAGSGAAAAAGSAASPEAATCFAEISSAPAGAEIVLASNVVGTTPQKLTLPCGAPAELVIRKGRFIAATRTITPTPEGVKLKVALAKPTFLLKVSSTPAGATITMNGKPLGITPTTVKVPAFEASTLTIAKDGYATETEAVSPKTNGVALHTTLKKLERKKPW